MTIEIERLGSITKQRAAEIENLQQQLRQYAHEAAESKKQLEVKTSSCHLELFIAITIEFPF